MKNNNLFIISSSFKEMAVRRKKQRWYTGDDENKDESLSLTSYEIATSPNDFNVKTIYGLISDGLIDLPNFQRNYVWSIDKASRFIESIIMGLPIPQIFLYEKGKNNWLVIDGQQRLMTIYYFINGRFPKIKYRAELRKIFDKFGGIPEKTLKEDEMFEDFKLKLVSAEGEINSPLNNLTYEGLSKEFKRAFDFRPIRNILITQKSPPEDNSSIYEIFNRLNTGGSNLNPQEIRASLYDSKFYKMLYRINCTEEWRKLLNKPEDARLKDVEILLRGFAMLYDSDKYNSPMNRFLNSFSFKMKKTGEEEVKYLEELFRYFILSISKLDRRVFYSEKNKFNISVYDAIFNAVCKEAFKKRNFELKKITEPKIETLKTNKKFQKAIFSETAKTKNVKTRLSIAEKIIGV